MLRVRTTFDGWPGGPGLQTFYFTLGSEDAAGALACVNAVHTLWSTYGPGLYPDQVSILVQPNVDLINAADGALTNTFVVAAPAVISGGDGAGYISPALAVLLRLETNNFVSGRRVRGRIFLSPIAALHQTADGTPDVTALGAPITAITDLMADIAASGSLVVWHRPKAGAGGLSCPVVTASTWAKFAVLRSRRD